MTCLRISVAVLGLILLAGCQKEEVRTYEIPKESPPQDAVAPVRMTVNAGTEAPAGDALAGTAPQSSAPMAGPMMQASGNAPMQALPGMAEQSAQFDSPTWTAPEGWQAQPLGSMRKGSWLIEKDGQRAEVSVLVFPGDVGGDLANVNRWADQVDMAPLTPQELISMQEGNAIEVDKHPGFLVELTGPSGQSIAGVILPYHGATWFFKMQGDTELVNAEAVNFGRFMSTVRFPEH